MSREMRTFAGVKAIRSLSFTHSEAAINSVSSRKIVLESTLLEHSIMEKGSGVTAPYVWKSTPTDSQERPVYNEIWYT